MRDFRTLKIEVATNLADILEEVVFPPTDVLEGYYLRGQRWTSCTEVQIRPDQGDWVGALFDKDRNHIITIGAIRREGGKLSWHS